MFQNTFTLPECANTYEMYRFVWQWELVIGLLLGHNVHWMVGTNFNEQHTDRIFCHTDGDNMVLQPMSPNRNKCKHQLAHTNFHFNCHGNVSQFQCVISILTALLSHAITVCAKSLIMLNEQAVLSVIQHILQTSWKCQHFYYIQFKITYSFCSLHPSKDKMG